MTNRLRAMTDPELEAALVDLGSALAPVGESVAGVGGRSEIGEARDVARAVRLRIEESGALVPGGRRVRFGLGGPFSGVPGRSFGMPIGGARRGLVLAIVGLLVLAGIAAAIGLGLPGLRIVFQEPSAAPSGSAGASGSPGQTASGPSRTPAPFDALDLGTPIHPATADVAAGYHVVLPTLPELGPPVAVYLADDPARHQVSAVYGAGPAFPAASGTSAAILVTEFPGAIEEGFLQKSVGPGTTVEPVSVGGHGGFWFSGAPHQLFYVRPDGSIDSDSVRLVGNVLAWSNGELTLRIEGATDLATALRIAGSMR